MRALGLGAPVVLVTAAQPAPELAARHGFAHYLGEPFSIDDLVGTIRRALDGDAAPGLAK